MMCFQKILLIFFIVLVSCSKPEAIYEIKPKIILSGRHLNDQMGVYIAKQLVKKMNETERLVHKDFSSWKKMNCEIDPIALRQ